MPTVLSKVKKPNNYYNAKQHTIPPPIAIKRAKWVKDAEDNAVTVFKLRSNPTQAKSQLYEMKARSFSTGSVEQFIMWKRDLHKIIKGQNITQAADKFEMTKRVLEGDALAVFEKIELDLAEKTEETFVQALRALATHVFPNNALSNQKSWLRRNEAAWKKKDVVTRTWVARLHEINEMLTEFPPNFNADQKLADDEFMEVLEYGVPPQWKATMVKHGFTPSDHTIPEFTEFCEKLEYSEQLLGGPKNGNGKGKKPKLGQEGGDHDTGPVGAAKTPQGGNKRRHKCQQTFAKSGGKDGCGYHIHTLTHTTNECKVVMSQIANMQAQAEAAPKRNNYKKQKYSNKGTPTNKSKDEGDLHILWEKVDKIKKSLEKAIKQSESEIGKRKREEKQVTFEEEEETVKTSNKDFDPDGFELNLEQLSISDDASSVNTAELEDLNEEEISA
jgi:hypothetical protein